MYYDIQGVLQRGKLVGYLRNPLLSADMGVVHREGGVHYCQRSSLGCAHSVHN